MKKRRTWRQLDQYDRDRIQLLLNRGFIQKEIAEVLGVDPSRISREINNRKKKDGIYNASLAQHKARINRGNSKYQGMKIEKNSGLKKFIIEQLIEKRSPDEIAGRMEREKMHPRIGKDAIYKWLYSVYGERYCKYLCTKRRKPRKHKKETKREMIPNRISIFKRPKRGRHAEGDTFLSSKGIKAAVAIVGLRKEKYLEARKIPDMKTESMKRAIWEIQAKIQFDTLTLDNGIENREHEQFGVDTYFCDPHAPWQKPFIEGAIGLARRWEIPKGTNLDELSEKKLEECMNFLNNKYRKSLGYKSARELAEEKGIIKRY